MSQVQADDELHCIRQSKIFSIADLAAFLGITPGVPGLQFVENAANVPATSPPITTAPAIYLGNVSGTLYLWSVANQVWVGIVIV